MRILFYLYSLHGGGAERVVATLANYWAKRGRAVVIATEADVATDSYQLDSRIKRVSFRPGANNAGFVSSLWWNVKRISQLRNLIREVRPDAAISMMTTANVLLALAAWGLTNVVRIGSERVFPPAVDTPNVWALLRKATYGLLDGVVALSDENARWLLRHTTARRVPVIRNPVEWPFALSQSEDVPPSHYVRSKYVLLAVGRFERQKGFDLLLEAFAIVATERPGWTLAILGDGPEKSNLLDQMKVLQLCDRVILPGIVSNVGDWYRTADVFVLSSRFEGFPNVLLEAMVHGVPAISFDCDTGPRDIIRPGLDGLLVEKEDQEALVVAMKRMMDDHEFRRSCAHRVVEARQRFSLEEVAGRWDNLVKEVRATRGSGQGV